MELTKNALNILKRKYLKAGEHTWDDLVKRVVRFISTAEISTAKQYEYEGRFYNIIYNGYFIPAGRILANAGTNIKNLFNCFTLPVEDSRESIYESVRESAEIFALGGGCGYNFSNVREEGAEIKGTGGKASGPLSFMGLYNTTSGVIKQASRRGACMGLLDMSHPDIIKFLNLKSSLSPSNQMIIDQSGINDTRLIQTLLDNQYIHFNISVAISDSFMNAVENDDDWDLVSPYSGEVKQTIKARELFDLLALRAWQSGDPGVFFFDTTNEDNMVDYIGAIDTVNPCAEATLLAGESCCLGAINLPLFYSDGRIDYPGLEEVIRDAIRFLDNVHTLSENTVEKLNDMSHKFRRLGLGVMGWADLLILMDIPYDSYEALLLGSRLSHFKNQIAWSESCKLGEERGAFPAYDADKANFKVIDKVFDSAYSNLPELDYKQLSPRNVGVTMLAPTGSIAILADVNNSIEPFFMLAYQRKITDGVGNDAKDVLEVTPASAVVYRLVDWGFSTEEVDQIIAYIVEHKSAQGCNLLTIRQQDVLRTAYEISPEAHIKMQAAWQTYVSGAISKTVNLPNESTVEDVKEAFTLMWKLGCKGGTIYRSGSKGFEILT